MSTTITETYVVEGYWVDGYAIDEQVVLSTNTPVTVQEIIPSYLYWEYADDSDLQAFVANYNAMAQTLLNTFNQLNLPVYMGEGLVSGALLDWVAEGLYGNPRPVLTTGGSTAVGTYNSVQYNTVPYDKLESLTPVTQIATTDDIFRRILTWNLYRGDGMIFCTEWLKRRVLRFLDGANGTDPGIDQTYLISVTFPGNQVININLSAYETANPDSTLPATLQAAMQSGALAVPFIYTFNVNL